MKPRLRRRRRLRVPPAQVHVRERDALSADDEHRPVERGDWPRVRRDPRIGEARILGVAPGKCFGFLFEDAWATT